MKKFDQSIESQYTLLPDALRGMQKGVAKRLTKVLQVAH